MIVFMMKSSQALVFAGKEPFPTIYVDSQKEDEVCKKNDLYKLHRLISCLH